MIPIQTRGDLLTVYLDIIFLENLFMNYIIIFATAIIIKEEIKVIKTFLSSLIGSIYAVIVYMNILKAITTNIFLKILLSIVMIYIAYSPKTIRQFVKELIVFYLTSFTFGGVAFALIYLISPTKMIIEKGVLIGTYPIKIILFGGILGFIIITMAFKSIKAKISKKDLLCNIKININSKSVCIKAIIDTGNFLKDPISNVPVMVVEKEKLRGVISDNILNNLDEIINGKDIKIDEIISKIKVIPFNSIGKENGMLLGVKADNIMVEMENNYKLVNEIIVGIYDGKLNKGNKYSGLIGLNILEDKGGVLENEYI